MNSELRDGRIQRLEQCAKVAFASKGYYSSSISQIVQQAGVARGTFYQYFDNKLHIFQSILDSFLRDLQHCIKPITLGPGAPPPLEQVEENLTRVLNLVMRERDLTQILLHHTTSPDRALETHLDDFYHQVSAMLQRSLDLGVAMNLVRSCDTRLTAHAIIGAVKEVVFQITSSEARQPPVEKLARELLQFGMGGVLTESAVRIQQATNRSQVLVSAHKSGGGQ